jgi:hypothetical protein
MKQRLSIGNLSLAREKESLGEMRKALFPIPLWRLSGRPEEGREKEGSRERGQVSMVYAE